MGSIPGMPHVAFLGLGLLCAALAYFIHFRSQQAEVVEEGAPGDAALSPRAHGRQWAGEYRHRSS